MSDLFDFFTRQARMLEHRTGGSIKQEAVRNMKYFASVEELREAQLKETEAGIPRAVRSAD